MNKLYVFKIDVDFGEYVGGVVLDKDIDVAQVIMMCQIVVNSNKNLGGALPITHDSLIFTCNTDKEILSTFIGGYRE